LDPDVACCLESYELDEDGRIIKARLLSKTEALKFLSRYHQLAKDVPDVPVQPMTVNHTEVFLSGLSTGGIEGHGAGAPACRGHHGAGPKDG
jgi:hypothetical protein